MFCKLKAMLATNSVCVVLAVTNAAAEGEGPRTKGPRDVGAMIRTEKDMMDFLGWSKSKNDWFQQEVSSKTRHKSAWLVAHV